MFELSDTQRDKLDKWIEAIELVHSVEDVGLLQYRFTPTGIGDIVSVYSEKFKVEIDLTEEDTW